MNDPKKERTLVLIKIDGIQRGLIGEIIHRYEQTGLKLVALKMLVPSEKLVEKHYTVDPEWRMKNGLKTIANYQAKGLIPPSTDPLVCSGLTLKKLVKYISSGPVIAMVWQGMHAVGVTRKITGGTEPLTSDVGTIRGDFTIDSYQVSDLDQRSTRNLVHASSSVEEAEKEIDLWFKKEEIINYKLFNESILYETNLNAILK
ncbi:MAG TPA: nucleoside-diphosphate kinase [Candidatus Woesebacteria bacterium]|nr:nucleoside-diphosphate kinase [Candidatus Woesebacteria bacterium]HRT40135.1 nucleoside-diphosphate kinase [Candidatus Woesebacteria bacterium]